MLLEQRDEIKVDRNFLPYEETRSQDAETKKVIQAPKPDQHRETKRTQDTARLHYH